MCETCQIWLFMTFGKTINYISIKLVYMVSRLALI